MPARIGKATLYLVLAYGIVTILGFLLTVLFGFIFHPPTAQQLGVPFAKAPAYLMTLPYQPLLNLAIWPWFAWLYFRDLSAPVPRALDAARLGVFWVATTMIIDLIGWVLIRHPWQMTFKEFYVDYEPWIMIIYLIILLSPRVVAQLTGQQALPLHPN